MVKVLIKKLNPSVQVPSYKTDGASGMDLMAFIAKSINLEPGKSCLVPTGLSVAFPKEYEIQIRPRSGLAAKQKISVLNSPGTIDADYRGEIKVILINHGQKYFKVEQGIRIAQMVLCPITKAKIKEVNELEDTSRGYSGYV